MSEVRYLKLKAVSQGYMFVLTLLVHVICVNFPEIEAYVGSRRAMEHGKCVLRWTGKTDITTATSHVWCVGNYFYYKFVRVRMKKWDGVIHGQLRYFGNYKISYLS